MDAKETSLFAAVLIASIVILVVIIYFILTIIRFHRRSVSLYKAKVLAEITTLENERKRMAADLHDELGPIVAGIKLKLGSLDELSPEDADTMNKVNQHLNELIARMKEISSDLAPPLLENKGLVAAMDYSVQEFNSKGKLAIRFEAHDIPSLDGTVSVNMYRILQEIIHNTLRHAGATVLKIELLSDRKNLIIQTVDNGKGFDYRYEAREHNGLGLRNLLSRTEMLEGQMYVETSAGKGTSYRFEIPLT
jgi:signal transduction histidine kinase